MRAYSSLYEEPTFEDPTAKEQSVVYAALGAAAVAVASTVAAIQMSGPPTWLSAAYVRTSPSLVYRMACLTSPCPLLPCFASFLCDAVTCSRCAGLQAATDRARLPLARRPRGLTRPPTSSGHRHTHAPGSEVWPTMTGARPRPPGRHPSLY